nr:helix-turn-helix transcriptional regulator [Ruegeria arenilitoris]
MVPFRHALGTGLNLAVTISAKLGDLCPLLQGTRRTAWFLLSPQVANTTKSAHHEIMTLENFFSGEGAPKFLKILSSCLASVGSADFNAHFLDMIEHVVKADQCMIFSYKRDRPHCYLSFNERQKQAAKNLAHKYLRGGYLRDPLRTDIEATKQDGQMRILTLRELSDRMPPDYWQEFFQKTGIVDKITVLARSDDEVVGMNFYRFQENGPFIISEDELRRDFWTLVSKIVLLHYAENQPAQLQSPLNSLSVREKEICEAILRGLTTDAIAWELDVAASTVNTYRKRAYEKLGINSKSALFALCA